MTVLYLFESGIGFIVMLSVMGFSFWIFISAILGATLGHWFFHIRRKFGSHIVEFKKTKYITEGETASKTPTDHECSRNNEINQTNEEEGHLPTRILADIHA